MHLSIKTMPQFAKNEISAVLQKIHLLQLTSALTIFLVIIFGFEHWLSKVIVNILFVFALIVPAAIRNAKFWLILAVSSTISLVIDWHVADNHKYLLVYWVWVVWIAHLQNDRDDAEDLLKVQSRFFLVFIFLVAAVQKTLSPTYMSGAMFELKLLFDERFRAFAYLAGIDLNAIEETRKVTSLLRSPLSQVEGNALELGANDWIQTVAKFITWYDLLVQALIGLLFIPRRMYTDLAAHSLLLFFIFTTYLPAPVFGFGWTLCILGVILAFHRSQWLVWSYFTALIAILLYQAPWREWVLST